MKNKTNLLTELLMDNTKSITERDDAAMELANFTEESVVKSLLSVAKNTNEDSLILNSCGESLGAIWTRNGIFDEKAFRAISGTARYGVYVVVKSRKPEWIEKYQLENKQFYKEDEDKVRP